MGKISKKYIGTDQVGSVQIELENALSLRAKNQAGDASIDLLEYSTDNQLVVQQNLYMADNRNLLSLAELADTFFIKSDNSAAISVVSNDLASGNTGAISLYSGNATTGNSGQINIVSGTAAGNSGHLSLETGAATGNRGDINTASRDFNINVPDSGRVKIFSDFGAGSYFDFFFTGFGEASDAASLIIQNAGSVLAFINQSFGQNNQAVGETIYSGGMIVSSTGGTYTAGKVTLESGSGSASFISATNVEVSSGDVEIVTRNGYIAGTGADASTGDILLRTGVELGAGVRGSITLDALEVQCSAMQFKDAADPTDAQDLATKAYVDAQISAGTTCDKQSITLSAGDISAQYVDLNEQFVPESLFVAVGQRVCLFESLDYTLSIVAGVTRLTFAGPSATGGAEALVDGDILYIQGIVDLSP
jgi:hypothetical protein